MEINYQLERISTSEKAGYKRSNVLRLHRTDCPSFTIRVKCPQAKRSELYGTSWMLYNLLICSRYGQKLFLFCRFLLDNLSCAWYSVAKSFKDRRNRTHAIDFHRRIKHANALGRPRACRPRISARFAPFQRLPHRIRSPGRLFVFPRRSQIIK